MTQERGRAVGAHAAGVESLVTFQRTFVILRGGKKCSSHPVAQRVQGDFWTVEKFLDHDLGARRAERVADQNIINRRVGLVEIMTNKDPFSKRETISFDGAASAQFLRKR